MKLAKDRKMHIAAYITVALELYEKESVDDIFAPYFFEYVVNKKKSILQFRHSSCRYKIHNYY